jgi:DNA-binding NarL/FixJ family response regulator
VETPSNLGCSANIVRFLLSSLAKILKRKLQSTSAQPVEDFPPFRRFIRSTLWERPDLRVVTEVSDGLEAVQRAAELRPDLILLDIGLPTMDGIEAARQIRKLSPESKIVFLSQESSADIMEEALNTGASGYVVKAKGAAQLLATLDAVILQRRFFTTS